MRIFATLAAVCLLAATPCMAQVVIPAPTSGPTIKHEFRADKQEAQAQIDELKAHANAAVGNEGAAQRDHEQAHRAVEDSQFP
jgi:hypothetical protein